MWVIDPHTIELIKIFFELFSNGDSFLHKVPTYLLPATTYLYSRDIEVASIKAELGNEHRGKIRAGKVCFFYTLAAVIPDLAMLALTFQIIWYSLLNEEPVITPRRRRSKRTKGQTV